jgi:stearoyl-CoA desaturase (delta-9 desaturase)
MTASNEVAPIEVSRPADDPVPQDSADQAMTSIPTLVYVGMQLGTLLVFVVGVSTADVVLCVATFLVRIFAITGVYHRYFSHRTYRTSRVTQFLLAFVGTMAVQKGPLWWASIHRVHHAESDGPGDPHSPRKSFWYSHQGWIFDPQWDRTRTELIRDLTRYPELVWLNRFHIVGPVTLGVVCFLIGGWSGLVWGFLVATTITWHATYSINSLAHKIGRKRYETGDDSKNSLLLALLTLGEGWHNNHHYHQSCARQGFYWWEIDITYYVLRGMQAVGLIWDIKEPPARVYRDAQASESDTTRLAA